MSSAVRDTDNAAGGARATTSMPLQYEPQRYLPTHAGEVRAPVAHADAAANIDTANNINNIADPPPPAHALPHAPPAHATPHAPPAHTTPQAEHVHPAAPVPPASVEQEVAGQGAPGGVQQGQLAEGAPAAGQTGQGAEGVAPVGGDAPVGGGAPVGDAPVGAGAVPGHAGEAQAAGALGGEAVLAEPVAAAEVPPTEHHQVPDAVHVQGGGEAGAVGGHVGAEGSPH
eukprot:1785286-Rhodomonas_salina.1